MSEKELSGSRRDWRVYGGFALLLIATALPNRLAPQIMPRFMVLYGGDALWATMIFIMLALILRRRPGWQVALIGVLGCWVVEVSQLYQAEWINALRYFHIGPLPLGGLILGYGFLWSDMLAYPVGIGLGLAAEHFLLLPLSRHIRPL